MVAVEEGPLAEQLAPTPLLAVVALAVADLVTRFSIAIVAKSFVAVLDHVNLDWPFEVAVNVAVQSIDFEVV